MESKGTGKERLDVPNGFRHLLENLTVEILRAQPRNIYKFAAEYFKERLQARQVNGYDDCLLGSQIDGFYRYEHSGPDKAMVDEAATKIQSSYRGHRVRQQVRSKTENSGKFTAKEDAAAVKIQAGYHGFKVRKELKAQNEAAVKIQSNFRGYSVRKQGGNDAGDANGMKTKLPNITEEDEAAIKIQTTYRGHQARKQVQETKKAKNEAAVKIQAGYRGFHERNKITKRKEEAAAVTIQAGYRGYQGRQLKRAQSDAAVKIQSVFRGYKTRKDLRQRFTKQSSLLGVSNVDLAEHRDSRSSFSLPEDVKFEGDLDEDSDSDIEKVMDKMEAYQKSIKSMKEIHVNPAEEAKFAAEKFDNN